MLQACWVSALLQKDKAHAFPLRTLILHWSKCATFSCYLTLFIQGDTVICCLPSRNNFMACICVLSPVQLFSPWAVACQAPLPMEFSRQEYFSGLTFFYSRGSSTQPRDWTCISCIGLDSFSLAPLGKSLPGASCIAELQSRSQDLEKCLSK